VYFFTFSYDISNIGYTPSRIGKIDSFMHLFIQAELKVIICNFIQIYTKMCKDSKHHIQKRKKKNIQKQRHY